MKRNFAEKVLIQALGYDPESTSIDPEIRVMEVHSKKYDDYQQFSPGFRFMESLSNWLHQFEGEDAKSAYEFVKNRLVYVSESQIRLLVESAYSAHIRPYMMRQIATEQNLPKHRVSLIHQSDAFKSDENRSLFLGLSDGARTDVFRRACPHLSNEQVWLTYSVSEEKIKDFKKYLKNKNESTFKYVWLMDDFSASGTSFIREEGGEWKGKIPKTLRTIQENREFFDKDVKVCVVLYIASHVTEQHFNSLISKYMKAEGFEDLPLPTLKIIQKLDKSVRLSNKNPSDKSFLELVDSDIYYDHSIYSDSAKVGGTKDLKRGYAEGCLPLVLAHNTPNNSVSMLWSFENSKFVGLFPRVNRH